MKTEPNSNHGTEVLLDTNFLLLPFQRRIDVFEEIPKLLGSNVTFLILPQIQEELNWLIEKGTTKNGRAAKAALKLVNQYCQLLTDLPITLRNLDADRALLQYASTKGAIVATNDGDLRRMLVKQGSRAIFLRKLAILAITEDR